MMQEALKHEIQSLRIQLYALNDNVTRCQERNNQLLEKTREQERLFESHTKAVKEFISDLYAIMVDPLADGTIKVDDMKKALLYAATRNRERWNG